MESLSHICRRIINPAFHLEKLKMMLPAFNTCCNEMRKQAREKVLQVIGRKTPNFDGLSHLKIVTMIVYEGGRWRRRGNITDEPEPELNHGNITDEANTNGGNEEDQGIRTPIRITGVRLKCLGHLRQVFIFQLYKYGVASLCYNLTNFAKLL
ncbi:hypothetical protein FRX31_012773 [Thalictrum thalictroides]|uniref:Uncharacterized protein n=1 Tax=Thalictrum thalictroides TaxID=46969 RepID=A0A7J6WJS5_THATH|nr:hypothetical protein FRX31_012773 [Thalictrum thalictroides]